mmetsp:Transcript_108915/g.318747  ORF Transcript_108915/g.318747 Transcript_108915/m.318747 type:complete len:246 (+) Transcript_108915:146-883(+)
MDQKSIMGEVFVLHKLGLKGCKSSPLPHGPEMPFRVLTWGDGISGGVVQLEGNGGSVVQAVLVGRLVVCLRQLQQILFFTHGIAIHQPPTRLDIIAGGVNPQPSFAVAFLLFAGDKNLRSGFPPDGDLFGEITVRSLDEPPKFANEPLPRQRSHRSAVHLEVRAKDLLLGHSIGRPLRGHERLECLLIGGANVVAHKVQEVISVSWQSKVILSKWWRPPNDVELLWLRPNAAQVPDQVNAKPGTG